MRLRTKNRTTPWADKLNAELTAEVERLNTIIFRSIMRLNDPELSADERIRFALEHLDKADR
jgi:hypothetical protein